MPVELTPQEYAVAVYRLPGRVRQVLRKTYAHAGPEAKFGEDEALERIRDHLMDSGLWEESKRKDCSQAVTEEDDAVRLSRLPLRIRNILERTRACMGDAATVGEEQAIGEIEDLVAGCPSERQRKSA